MEEQITYSKAISELEDIIRKMQSNECSIDNLSQLTSRSLQLLTICKDKLTKTDEELKKILSQLSDEQ
ncbi:MAG: exodeoxyribonuclease VII small subunit [Bacteroidales bacterium]|nr:exodeoxyribonuclease VII small subunit [Bacteroidales bacterium]